MSGNQHPFVSDRKYSLLYILTWTLTGAVHVLLLAWQESFPVFTMVQEALVSSFLLALLGLVLWYPVRFMDAGKSGVMVVLSGYVLAGALMLLLWLGLSNLLLRGLVPDEPSYHAYLRDSLPWKIIGGAFLYLIIILVYYLIMSWNRLREKERKEARLETLVRESELRMLRSQINPHFLFNSLNSISALTLTDPGRARDMVVRLSEFFRYSLDHKLEEESTLEEELKNIENYLAIEQVRFGDRFLFEKAVPESCLRCRLPNLILQPLFENAIKHGVYESTSPVTIRLEVQCEDTWLRLRLNNNFDTGITRTSARKGIGLLNIAQRLELRYNREGLMGVEREPDQFTVTLLIPQET